ncbi:MAG: hypothetical protein E7269_01010 [Lachnospiraceae bacterium]|nr:hypothetical protein [Lachnospiraceae bacterium]
MNSLCDIIYKYQNEIYEVATNNEIKRELEQEFYKEILKVYKEKELNEEDYVYYREAYYNWFTNSSVSDTYKNDWREMVAFFVGAFALTIPWTAFFLIIFFSLYALEKANAIYLMGPIYMAPVAGFTGFLMGICTSYFIRLKAYKLLFRKSYQKYAELDTIANGSGSYRFIKIFALIVFAGSIIFLALNVRCNLRFTDDGFYDNRKFWTISGEKYDYSEIEEIYYLPARKNGFGATLNAPSYVMKLKNGEEIDFYDYDETTSTEKNLLPLLKEKGIIIREK